MVFYTTSIIVSLMILIFNNVLVYYVVLDVIIFLVILFTNLFHKRIFFFQSYNQIHFLFTLLGLHNQFRLHDGNKNDNIIQGRLL